MNKYWTVIIRPVSGWMNLDLAELWRYRDLITLFARRDFVATYKQTILGPLWFFLQPVLSTCVFTVVFGRIARIPTEGIPPYLFYLAGIVAWNYFASCFSCTSDTFVANAGMFGKVYFPRLIVPISVVLTGLFAFSIQFMLFIVLLVYFMMRGASVNPNLWILATPLLLVQMALLGLGIGIIVSSVTTKYRDLKYLVGFGIQLWMYLTPVVYPLSEIPDRWRLLFFLNPMSATIEAFRFAFLGAGSVNLAQLGMSVGITFIALVFGLLLFSRVEKTFMDTV